MSTHETSSLNPRVRAASLLTIIIISTNNITVNNLRQHCSCSLLLLSTDCCCAPSPSYRDSVVVTVTLRYCHNSVTCHELMTGAVTQLSRDW